MNRRGRPAGSGRATESADALFQALGHPARRSLLDRLMEEPGLTVSELAAGFAVTRQAVSRHLEILEQARLVAVRWSGRDKLHYANPAPLCELSDGWLARYTTPQVRALLDVRDMIEGAAAGTERPRRHNRSA